MELPEGTIPAIVNQEDFDRVGAILTRNKASAARNNKNPERALLRGGYAVCAHCGKNMIVSNETRHKDGTYSYFYKCTSRKNEQEKCIGSTVRVDVLDQFVWMQLTELLMHPEKFTEYLRHYQKVDPTIKDRSGYEKQRDMVYKQIANTTRAIGLMDDEEGAEPLVFELKNLQERKKKIQVDLDALKKKHEEWASHQVQVHELSNVAKAGLGMLKMRSRTYQQMRSLVEMFGIKATIFHHTEQNRFTVEMDVKVDEVFRQNKETLIKTLMETKPLTAEEKEAVDTEITRRYNEGVEKYGGVENIPYATASDFDDLPTWEELKGNLLTSKGKKSSFVNTSIPTSSRR